MKARALILALALAVSGAPASAQVAQGTAFTFQGVLQQSGVPLNGTPNLEFRLFDSTLAPTGPIVTKSSWPVSNGQLTVDLDFGGGVFNGQARYLQITVNGTVLTPLLPISSTPYAIAAQSTVPNSVNGMSVVDGTVGSADIDASIQRRVAGTCSGGNAIRAIDAAGAVTCEPVGSGAGGGDITAITTPAASGLFGGAASGEVTLGIGAEAVVSGMIANGTVAGVDIADGSIQGVDVDPASVQRRITFGCTTGSAIRFIDAAGVVSCEPVGSGAGGGDITGITTPAISGLVGGAASGEVTLGIGLETIVSAMIANGNVLGVDIADGTIQGVDVDPATVQRRANNSCSSGTAIRAIDNVGVFTCQPVGIQTLQAVPGGGLQIYEELGAWNANIANAGVTAAKIAPDAINSAKILDNSITGADIASGSIHGFDIQDGSISSVDIQENSIGGVQLANNSVGGFKIDPTQVQIRVKGSCVNGATIQRVDQDGSVTCAQQWSVFGNTGTTANHFVGTLDGAPLRLQGSAVGVNTPAPLTSLHVRAGPESLVNGEPDPGTIINAERAIGNAFISIMGGVGQQRGLIFGDPNSAAEGGIFYDNGALDLMDFRTGGNVVRAILGVSDIDGAGGDGAVANLRLRGTAGGMSYVSTTGTGASSRLVLGFEGATSRVQIHPTYTSIAGTLAVDNGLQLSLGNLEVQSGTGLKPGGGSWGIYSDARLKHHVEPLQGALDRLLALRGVDYEYLPSDSPLRPAGKHTGFIAQEVREVFPEWVGEAKDGYLYVSPKGFEALTVEALRDLKAGTDVEIEALREDNAQLRGELTGLRSELDAMRTELRVLSRRK